MEVTLFPIAEYWWLYAAFLGFVFLLLALDLGVFHREAHVVSIKEAAIWSVIWIALALAFNYGLFLYASWKFPTDPRLMALPGFDPQEAARQVSLEYLTGYIVEKSLSIDNVFIFVMIFSFFAIPALYQHRILFYGILGALVFRSIFIALGSVLMEYQWVVLLFGAFLVITGIKMLVAPDKPMDPDKNLVVRLFRKILPVTPQLHGQKFFVRINGVNHATPLMAALVFAEATDVIFAVDSVPAIFALTSEPMIVFTSNIFALLGLRSLYFVLAGAVTKFYMLKYGLALVLIFVGLKMVWLNRLFGGHFPITWSLGVIAGVIALSMILSVAFPRKTRSTAHESR